MKKQLRTINRIAAGKGRDFRKRLQDAYRDLLDVADRIIARATELLDPALISDQPRPRGDGDREAQDEVARLVSRDTKMGREIATRSWDTTYRTRLQ